MSERQTLGRDGEARAAAYLRAHGLVIETANWRPTGGALAPFARGEIDLVARDGATLVFVEVRSRHGAPGRAEELVTPAKQRRLLTLAQAYLATYDLPRGWRGLAHRRGRALLRPGRQRAQHQLVARRGGSGAVTAPEGRVSMSFEF